MRGLDLTKIEKGYLSDEIRRTTLETIQFGAYGVGQEFEMEMTEGASPKPVLSKDIVEDIKSLIDEHKDIFTLHENRVENAKELVNRFPNSYKAWLNLTTTYINGGEIEKAREALEKAKGLAPEEDSVKAMLGRIEIFEGNIEKAILTYKEIMDRGSNIAARESIAMLNLASGKIDEAIDELKVTLEEDTKKRPSLCYNLGIAHLAKGKCGRAISYFRKSLQRDDRYHIAYSRMGIAYSILGQKTKAEKMFRIAVETDPEDPEARLNLSRALESLGKWSEVIITLSSTIQDYPNYWQAREALARAYLETRRFKEAEVQFKRIIIAIEEGAQKGDLSIALNNVGVAYLLQEDFSNAEEYFKRSIEISNRVNTLAILNLARTFLASNRVAKIEPLLLELKEKLGDNNDVLNLSARYYYFTNDFSKAMEQARKIITKDPTDLDGAYIMSCLLDDVYDGYVEAEQILRNLLESGKSSGTLLNNLAYTLILQGKLGEARNFLEKIMPDTDDIDPGIPMATWGLWYLKKGDIAKGASYYNEGCRMSKDKEIQKMILQKKELELGILNRNIGNNKIARRFFERAAKAVVKEKVYTKKAQHYLEENI